MSSNQICWGWFLLSVPLCKVWNLDLAGADQAVDQPSAGTDVEHDSFQVWEQIERSGFQNQPTELCSGQEDNQRGNGGEGTGNLQGFPEWINPCSFPVSSPPLPCWLSSCPLQSSVG